MYHVGHRYSYRTVVVYGHMPGLTPDRTPENPGGSGSAGEMHS